jgi:two-component system, chemotaxis family, chemotaxis protein CheY
MMKKDLKNIMIVDDSKTAREFLVMILKDAGYTTTEAGNGNECLEKATVDNPDLVIMDIIMPDREGIETIIILKKTYPELPVIAVSGAAMNETYLKNAKKFGARAVLQKPFTGEQILGEIRKILAK